MSVRIMSTIFETEFTNLKDAKGNVTKASTLKLVLLALADHADDTGGGAYPGLTRMQLKTALSRQGVLNAYDALIHHGIIRQVGISKLGTNTYVILVAELRACFGVAPDDTVNPVATGSQSGVPVVNPVATGLQSSVPVVNTVEGVVNPVAELVNPVDLNHPLTTLKPSNERVNTHENFQEIWSDLESLCASVPSQAALLINIWLEKHPPPRIHQAIETARENRASSPKYVDSVLINWERNGYPPTREQRVLARAYKPARGKSLTTLLMESIKNGD